MHQENIHSAKTNLSKLIARALKGEEIIIAKNGVPVVRLQPITKPKKKLVPGSMKGKFSSADLFFTPEMEKEIDDMFFGKKDEKDRRLGLIK